jgi:hypothetical protein
MGCTFSFPFLLVALEPGPNWTGIDLCFVFGHILSLAELHFCATKLTDRSARCQSTQHIAYFFFFPLFLQYCSDIFLHIVHFLCPVRDSFSRHYSMSDMVLTGRMLDSGLEHFAIKFANECDRPVATRSTTWQQSK